jgi:hypothetical protein
MKKLLGFLTIACDNQFLLMKVCNNYSLIHKFLINHILLQTVLIIGVCGACRRKKLYTLKMENVNIREDYDQKVASDSSGLSGGFRGIGRGFGL